MRCKVFNTIMTATLMLLLSAGLKAQIVKAVATTSSTGSISFVTEANPIGKKLFAIKNQQGELFSAYIAHVSHELENQFVRTTQVTYAYKFGNSEHAFFAAKKSGSMATEFFGLDNLRQGIYENLPLEKFPETTVTKITDESPTGIMLEFIAPDGRIAELPLVPELVRVFLGNDFNNMLVPVTLWDTLKSIGGAIWDACVAVYDWIHETCWGAITNVFVSIVFPLWDPFDWGLSVSPIPALGALYGVGHNCF
jgi:hypothetical protein